MIQDETYLWALFSGSFLWALLVLPSIPLHYTLPLFVIFLRVLLVLPSIPVHYIAPLLVIFLRILLLILPLALALVRCI